jgi:pyruvate-formate lyase-activating enzyme
VTPTRDDADDRDGPRGRGLALRVSKLVVPAAPRPLFLRRDRPFDAAAHASDVADVLRYVAAARRTLRGPLALEIEGPGDPLASAESVLRALALLHEHHPDVLTGLAIDGPLLDEYAEELVDFGLAYVRVRLDTLRPRIARRLVAGAIHRGDALDRADAAALLLEQAPRALHVARRHGIPAVARITLFPTLNLTEVGALARAAARAGAEEVEVLPHVPLAGAPLARAGKPNAGELAEARAEAAEAFEEERFAAPNADEEPFGQERGSTALHWLSTHRTRVVPLDDLDADDLRHLLPEVDESENAAKVLPPRRAQLVAVASEDGTLVDLPLTHAAALRIYAVTPRTIHPVGVRPLVEDPRRKIDGVGHAQDFLGALVGCRALVATRIPARAATLLKAVGIVPIAVGGTVTEVLDRVARGTLRALGS